MGKKLRGTEADESQVEEPGAAEPAAPKAPRQPKAQEPAPQELRAEPAGKRRLAFEDELVAFSTRIPRRLADGLADLAHESRKSPKRATIAQLTADAIEVYLRTQRGGAR